MGVDAEGTRPLGCVGAEVDDDGVADRLARGIVHVGIVGSCNAAGEHRHEPRLFGTGDRRLARQAAPGTFVTGSQPLRPGNSYTARVYTPKPTVAQLRGAGREHGLVQHTESLCVSVQPRE